MHDRTTEIIKTTENIQLQNYLVMGLLNAFKTY